MVGQSDHGYAQYQTLFKRSTAHHIANVNDISRKSNIACVRVGNFIVNYQESETMFCMVAWKTFHMVKFEHFLLYTI